MDIINRYKKLATDTALFTVSTFASKLLSIFMLPFYTNILTASDYGTADMITTTVSLIFPVLTMGICDGVLRFCLDKDSDKKAIFTIGLRIVLAGTALLVIATPKMCIRDRVMALISDIVQSYVGFIIIMQSLIYVKWRPTTLRAQMMLQNKCLTLRLLIVKLTI